ncbi:MAG: AI-2E family transporter [Thermodesulfovibrionales bacterium]|nr:AI-2E family transporter [Thermodesulfovibrionales bacterium]
MKVNRFYLLTVIFLIILFGYLLFRIINPFINSLIWAVVLTIIFFPLYSLFLKYLKRDYIAALLTVLIVIAFILGPFTYFGILLATELRHLSQMLTEERLMRLKDLLSHPAVSDILSYLERNFGITAEQITGEVIASITSVSKAILNNITRGITNIIGFAINFIFMIFALFFFLIGGPYYLKKVLEYLPFSEYEKKRLTCLVRDIIISTIYGGVVVALIQAFIGGISFWILGIPTPVIWGSAIAIASFIPILGAFSVWGPAALYLFLTGSILEGFILTAIGALGISTVDNILKPIIIGSRTKMPTIVLFFSVLGGIKEFGLIGLIAGPLVVALFIAVIEIFRKMEQER